MNLEVLFSVEQVEKNRDYVVSSHLVVRLVVKRVRKKIEAIKFELY